MPEVNQITVTPDSSKLGQEFLDALDRVLITRADRADQYGDTYLGDDYMFLYYQVLNKMKRFKLQMSMESGQEQIINREVALDSAIDCANYAIFIIAKILKDESER